jgi:glycosyltransferase involved in cell wall biosynthesis
MEKISVVIPAYNHEFFIGEAIQSVLENDYPNYEIIVVDDGSHDGTSGIVKSFLGVKYFYQKNSGAPSAINKGISVATGKYIAILNDDDMFASNHLRTAVLNLRSYENDFFIGTAECFGYGPKLHTMENHIFQSKVVIKERGLGMSLFNINWSTSTSSFVFKRNLVDRLGGFHNFSMCHDLDFLLRGLLVAGMRVGVSESPTWHYRCHGSNSGSRISIGKQNSEVIYCLGRSINSIIDELSPESLIQLIGYGISPDLILEMVKMKPWLNEADLGVDLAIHNWVDYCASNYSQ